jgi:hypothetical protein
MQTHRHAFFTQSSHASDLSLTFGLELVTGLVGWFQKKLGLILAWPALA